VLGLILVFAFGLVVGGVVAFALPSAALLPADRQSAALAKDTAPALDVAAAFGDDSDASLHAAAALADALLVADHGGGATELKRADSLLRTTLSFVRIAPEALYARAILKRYGVDDNALGEDLEKRAEERAHDPWWLLAKSARLFDEGKREDATALAQRAAFGEGLSGGGAPAQAQVMLARLAFAHGDFADTAAVASRIAKTAPDDAGGLVIGALAAAIVDAQDGDSPEKRAIKLKRIKQRAGDAARRDGPPKPGQVKRDDDEALLATWRTPEEDRALEKLDKLDERDAAVIALALEAVAVVRGDDDLASSLKRRVLSLGGKSAVLAARQAELSVLAGDVASAEEVLASALEKNPREPSLLLAQARAHALGALSDDEIKLRASSFTSKRIAPDGIALAFGKLAFDAWAPSVPFVAEPDPSVSPEAAFATSMRAPVDKLPQKLDAAVLAWKGESALLRGDVAGATAASAAAREKAASDPDVLFLDARIKVQQGDRGAATDAIEAALAQAPDDPHALLTAAKLHYANEAFIPAKKAITKLRALGFKSPAALALDAMIDARRGDERAAQAALSEAQTFGADDVEVLRATVLLLRDGPDLEAVRKAATRLLHVDHLRASDPILRSWEADAAAREGDTLRAQTVLGDVLTARPNLADAWLLLGSIQAGTDPTTAALSFAKAIERAPGTPVASEAIRRRAALKNPASTAQTPLAAPKKKKR
jgi:Flp pilus assembly protein TadD